MNPRTPLAATLLTCAAMPLAAPLLAQVGGHAVVAIAAAVAPATILVDADLAGGSFNVLPGFLGDTLPPLAIAVDPVDRDLLLALDAGTTSRIVELRRTPTGFAATVLGDAPPGATALLVDRLGDVVVATRAAGGGFFRIPRHGGSTTTVRTQAILAGVDHRPELRGSVRFGRAATVSPASPVAIGTVDLDNGQLTAPLELLTGLPQNEVLGLVDLPGPTQPVLLAHEDGTLSRFVPGSGLLPLPVPTSPTLQPGEILGLADLGNGHALLLGGAPTQLFAIDLVAAAAGGATLQPVGGGPWFATPVAFAFLPDVAATTMPFAPGCGSAAELHIGAVNGELPRIGNAAFGIALDQAQPGLVALLGVGFAEGPVVALPNGCRVLVTPAFVAVAVADAGGAAALSMPLPARPALIGAIAYGQWFQDDLGVPFVTSRVLAIHVGP